ncbi:hypothetical protein ACJW31_08G086100 [Castanea mollissima]
MFLCFLFIVFGHTSCDLRSTHRKVRPSTTTTTACYYASLSLSLSLSSRFGTFSLIGGYFRTDGFALPLKVNLSTSLGSGVEWGTF